MGLQDELSISLTILLTGVVVVFSVLVVLTFVIKIYGEAIHRAGGRSKKAPVQAAVPPAPVSQPLPAAAPVQAVEEDGIPAEVIAAIAAAVYSVCGEPASSIRSVRRVGSRSGVRSAWGGAGRSESTRPF